MKTALPIENHAPFDAGQPKKTAKYIRMQTGENNPSVESEERGHISLFRSIRQHWIWQDAEKLKWWIDILLEVNHKQQKILLGGKLVVCNRGQSINSLQTWAKRWRADKSAVRRFFKLLESDYMIVTENIAATTRLTVCNYGSYQDWRHSKNEENQSTNTIVEKNDTGCDQKPTQQTDCKSDDCEGVRNENETQMKRTRNADETDVTPNNNDNNDNKRERSGKPPTLQQVKDYFLEKGYAEAIAEKAFNYYDAGSWKDSKGNKVKNWKQKMQSVWFRDEHKIKPSTEPTADQFDYDTFYGRPKVKLPWE